MYIRDLESKAYAPALHEGVKVKAIGWLGNAVETEGELDQKYIQKLHELKANNSKYDDDMGLHTCEICFSYEENGEFWLTTQQGRYVMPRMLMHYILVHKYLPPKEFLDKLDELEN